MQQWSEDNQHDSNASPLGKFTVSALLCFSLAGLLAGFAYGGFLRHVAGNSAASSGLRTKTTSTEHGASSTAAPAGVFLGYPIVGTGDYDSSEQADGTTRYTFSAQIVNKGTNTPITTTDVTCRFWLTDDANATATALSDNNYALPRTLASFNQPFPHEIDGALNFTSPSQQTQPCATNGKTTWTYTLSPTVHHGNYFLAILSDWKGIHYNWYLVTVKVVNQGSEGE